MEQLSQFNNIVFLDVDQIQIGSPIDVLTYDKLSNEFLGMMNGKFNDNVKTPADLLNDENLSVIEDTDVKSALLSNSVMQLNDTNSTAYMNSYAYITYVGNSKVMILNLEPKVAFVCLRQIDSEGTIINSPQIDVSSIGTQSNRMLIICESPNEVDNISVTIHENSDSPHCNASLYVISVSDITNSSQLRSANTSRYIHSSGRVMSDSMDGKTAHFDTISNSKWESNSAYSKNTKVRFINLLYIGNKKYPNSSFPFHLISYNSRFSNYQNDKIGYYDSDLDTITEFDATTQLCSEYGSHIDKGNSDKSPITYSENNPANNVIYDGNTMTYELIDNTENNFNWKRLWVETI